MIKKFLIIIILGVVVAITAGILFLRSGAKQSYPDRKSAGLIVEKNAIYVAEQVPSSTVSVALVRLEKPGFVVIHEDANDSPGKILGVSGILGAGETQNLSPIKLSRPTKDGETIYAMIHLDDGDGVFNASQDGPAIDPVGGEPVMTIVAVSQDAVEPGMVKPHPF
jgi:hypothetical protein